MAWQFSIILSIVFLTFSVSDGLARPNKPVANTNINLDSMNPEEISELQRQLGMEETGQVESALEEAVRTGQNNGVGITVLLNEGATVVNNSPSSSTAVSEAPWAIMEDTQEALYNAGYTNVVPTGIYDAATEAAVTDAQQQLGLQPTGIVDEAFLSALNGDLAAQQGSVTSQTSSSSGGQQASWVPVAVPNGYSREDCNAADFKKHSELAECYRNSKEHKFMRSLSKYYLEVDNQ